LLDNFLYTIGGDEFVKRSILLEKTETPDGKSLALYEHDGKYVIRVDGVELMSTRRHASEERLAELVCAGFAARKGIRVLVGGLGFGFTLRAALAQLAPDATVIVSELMPQVVVWNKNPTYGLAADCLADRRVTVVERDVARLIDEGRASYDGIMLDVDNGPGGFTTDFNDNLYEETGLYRIQGALKPGGIVGFWSASADPLFAKRLSKAGFSVDVQRARAHTTSGGWHTLFLAKAPAKRK
jgi:spermidine synthase